MPDLTLTLPTVHLNGTSREMLLSGYTEAYEKLRAALAAFYNIEFNARDYYVQSDYAYNQARVSRDKVRDKYNEINEYLEAHIVHLCDD